jgi:hypothetical protein
MLFATISRGKKAGTRLLPHLFQDNRYRVQLGKKGPYIPVPDYREIPSYLANGYSLLMSDRVNSQTPSLIRPQSIRGWSVNSQDLFFSTR